MANTKLQIICVNPSCGFRVDDNYFVTKKRFAPGICPRDGRPVAIVEAYTDNVVEGKRVDINPRSDTAGQILDTDE